MKLLITVGSVNDIITNSSTEILSIRTTHTPEMLKEIILNYAMCNDEYAAEYGVDPDSDLSISKIDTLEDIDNEIYGGTLSTEERSVFRKIICKRYGYIQDEPGELYIITIEHHLIDTINFIINTLGAV